MPCTVNCIEDQIKITQQNRRNINFEHFAACLQISRASILLESDRCFVKSL